MKHGKGGPHNSTAKGNSTFHSSGHPKYHNGTTNSTDMMDGNGTRPDGMCMPGYALWRYVHGSMSMLL